MKKRIRVLDDNLRKMTDEMEDLKYRLRRELVRKNTNKEKIHELTSKIKSLEKERYAYYEKNFGDNKRIVGARHEWSTTPHEDAKIATELCYPKSVITALLNEPDKEKRQKILINARNGIY